MITIPFLFFLIFFIYLYKKNKGIDLSSYLVIPYIITSFFAIIIVHFEMYDHYNGIWKNADISVFAIITYCLLISLSIFPFSKIRSNNVTMVVCNNYKYIDILSYVLIFTFISTVYTTYNNLGNILQSSLYEVRSEVYKEVEVQKVTGINWLIQLPYTLFKQFSPLALLFFFNNVANGRKTKLFNYLLFVSSLTPIVSAILIAGRTQIIYWLLTFGLIYVFYRRMLTKKQKKYILKPFIIFGYLIGVFFIIVTISRFYTNQQGSGDESVIVYLGQQFLQFNYFFSNYECHQITLNRIFPLTYYFLIDPTWNLTDYRWLISSQNGGIDIGVFYTFLGDLLVDIDFVGMFLYVIIYSFISSKICSNKNNTIELRRLILVLVLILIPLQGVFYYSYYRVDVSYFVLGSLLLYWSLGLKKINYANSISNNTNL